MLPVESLVESYHRKVRIFNHSEHLGVERDNIVFEDESKGVFCCG